MCSVGFFRNTIRAVENDEQISLHKKRITSSYLNIQIIDYGSKRTELCSTYVLHIGITSKNKT